MPGIVNSKDLPLNISVPPPPLSLYHPCRHLHAAATAVSVPLLSPSPCSHCHCLRTTPIALSVPPPLPSPYHPRCRLCAATTTVSISPPSPSLCYRRHCLRTTPVAISMLPLPPSPYKTHPGINLPPGTIWTRSGPGPDRSRQSLAVPVLVPEISSGTGLSSLWSSENGPGPDQTELPQHYATQGPRVLNPPLCRSDCCQQLHCPTYIVQQAPSACCQVHAPPAAMLQLSLHGSFCMFLQAEAKLWHLCLRARHMRLQ